MPEANTALIQHPRAHQHSERGKAPGPGSIMWDTFSDLAVSPFSIAVLIMQAAHPDIGAAVADYSIYTKDPWGRLFRTGFSMMRFLYGGKQGQQSRAEAKDLRALHAHIKGTHANGEIYYALNPQTFRIVPDTFLDAVIRLREVLGQPLTADEREKLYQEYIDLCLLFGIPRETLEAKLDDFLLYYDNLLLNTMNYNETVSFLLGDMMRYGPAMKYLPMPEAWRKAIYVRTLFPISRLFTLGFIDPRFRQRHGIPWSEKDEKRYRRGIKVVQWVVRIVPRFLRYHPFALWIMLGGNGPKVMDFERLQQMRFK
jgi:uncharacterized protein (DUF2236 family)